MAARRWAKWALVCLLFHEAAGFILAWSDTVGGAFSPGPYAVVGVALSLLFVAARLVLWLIVLPGAIAAVVAGVAQLARQRSAKATNASSSAATC